ncbi:secondary thiamine-phosphate synthase enzyme YjbQ [Candidatus Woesearchaeota archaeon]|nr:secondary thiamine-phosphate synthase enzyme YjbQ [Candidatus Woesearchaeota archaeon]
MINEFEVSSSKRNELIDITEEVEEIVKESKVKEGICVVSCPHTTAAITINEGADPDVKDDVLKQLERMVPFDKGYKHSEGNSDAHIKSSLVGASELVIIEDGKLKLGRWQKLFFAEFDGPRNRRVVVKLLK